MVAMKLAIAALATVAVAAPTTIATTTTEAKPFSFSQWVDDIINPDVVALTPEQAVEAYYQSINATTSTHDGAAKVKRFSVQCYPEPDKFRPDVNAAVMCINSLAALGSGVRYKFHYDVEKPVKLCHDIPGVELYAGAVQGSADVDMYATAHDLAVAGGHIMDACTWGGKTGGFIYEDFNPSIGINLRAHW